MKNYTDSDYAINKNAKGIVYRFADQTVEITLEDYLRENPDKTEADFTKLKFLSDSDYCEQVKSDYRQTWKNVPICDADTLDIFYTTPSSEDEFINQGERATQEQQRYDTAMLALGELTDVQLRRYLMYHVQGLSTWKISEIEGTNQKSVHESLQSAEKKIRKFLTNG